MPDGQDLSAVPARIALDTSCVVNLLCQGEAPNSSLLGLMRLGTEGRTRIIVTPIVDDEVPKAPEAGSRSIGFIRQRLAIFAVDKISAARRAERDALGERLLDELWPNRVPGSRGGRHSRRDCMHLASLALCGGGVFLTLDDRLRRKARRHTADIGVEVLSPDELGARLAAASHARAPLAGLVVRRARADDASEIKLLLDSLRDSYPDFEKWLQKALDEKQTFVGVFEGTIAGLAVWSKKDQRVVKLSTFYVGDDFRGRGLGPYLIFHQLRQWVQERVEKVYVTVAAERTHVLQFLVAYGFRVEGASLRRYADGSAEFVLAKHLFYEEVDDAELDSFLGRLSDGLFAALPNQCVRDPTHWFLAPTPARLSAVRDPQGVVTSVAVGAERESRTLSLSVLEEVVYPARLDLEGRSAYLIPIQPRWADAMIEVRRAQQPLFPSGDRLLLRTDNAYYCRPRLGEERLSSAPVMFYVSAPESSIAGFARILSCRIAPPADLFVEFGDIGAYTLEEIAAHASPAGGGQYSGCAMALRFAWWVPFPSPVRLQRLRAEFGLQHPQTVTEIPYEMYARILHAGGIAW